MQWINRIWNGQEKLWKVFWIGLLLPFLLSLLVGFIAGLIKGLLQLHGPLINFTADGMAMVMVPYYIIWAVFTWSCSSNTSHSAWKYIGCTVSALFALSMVAQLVRVLNPTPISDYNAACVKTLEDFAQKNNIDPQKYLTSNRSYLEKCSKEFNKKTCLGTMQDFAVKNGLNAQDYITQNQPYLRQCMQSLEETHSENTPPIDGGSSMPFSGQSTNLATPPGVPKISANPALNTPAVVSTSTTNITGDLPIKLGDTVAQVQAALHTQMQPETDAMNNSPFNAGKTFIHLKTEGIWAFFNRDGKIYTIRLDAPYKGAVFGIHVGDNLTQIKSVLGEPIKKPTGFGNMLAYYYAPNDITTLRIDINAQNEAEVIFLVK